MLLLPNFQRSLGHFRPPSFIWECKSKCLYLFYQIFQLIKKKNLKLFILLKNLLSQSGRQRYNLYCLFSKLISNFFLKLSRSFMLKFEPIIVCDFYLPTGELCFSKAECKDTILTALLPNLFRFLLLKISKSNSTF